MTFNYEMRFSKTGRARYIAHLDTLSCLVRAIRRTGFDLAYTQGMRPKPILSLAMPLGVGVEGEDEICDFSLRQRAPIDELARRLNRELPGGMELKAVGPTFDVSKAASRVGSVSHRIEFAAAPPALSQAIESYNAAGEYIVLRQRPKGDKEVDIKKYITRVEPLESGIAFDMAVTNEGTARPDEIVRALSALSGEELAIRRVVRTAIVLNEEKPKPPPGRPRPGARGRRR
ncbi:MAG: TIGR03936 family radical SAM-associated protein [Thermoleophilia bacterium]